MTGRAPTTCVWCDVYDPYHVCTRRPAVPALLPAPVRRGGRRCTVCRSLTHDRRTCVDPRAVELRRQREIALQQQTVQMEAEVQLQRVEIPEDFKLLAEDQTFVLVDTSLYLEHKGPYGEELFLLEEGINNVPEMFIATATYSKDDRNHLLKCTDEGVIIEPQSADDCPICMEPCYARYEIKNNLRCGHQVCLGCIAELSKCNKCPLCRADLQ